MATRSFFCFLDDRLMLLGAVLSKRQQKWNMEGIILSGGGKKRVCVGLILLGEEGFGVGILLL